jgi:hypothetical protein
VGQDRVIRLDPQGIRRHGVFDDSEPEMRLIAFRCDVRGLIVKKRRSPADEGIFALQETL